MASRVTDKQILEALHECAGIKSAAAQKLGISPALIRKRIEKSHKLRDAVAEFDERVLDQAEAGLYLHLKQGNLRAILFILRCKGARRGWVERSEVELKDQQPVSRPVDLSGMSKEELFRLADLEN